MKCIDEKYIPDTIARVSDIPSIEGLATETYVDEAIINNKVDFYVTVIKRDNSTEVDKTLVEIEEAYQLGKTIKCLFASSDTAGEKMYLNLVTRYDANHFVFIGASPVDGIFYRVVINSNGVACDLISLATVDSIPTTLKNPNALTINGESYDGSSAILIDTSELFYINIAKDSNGNYSSDKIMGEIAAAYESGKQLIAIYNSDYYQLREYDIWKYNVDPGLPGYGFEGNVYFERVKMYQDAETYYTYEVNTIAVTGSSYLENAMMDVYYETHRYNLTNDYGADLL
jgi:hypothetical protein